jgi:hypothetical protein
MLDVPIYGRIATLELFRPPVSSYTLFFLLRKDSEEKDLKDL